MISDDLIVAVIWYTIICCVYDYCVWKLYMDEIVKHGFILFFFPISVNYSRYFIKLIIASSFWVLKSSSFSY